MTPDVVHTFFTARHLSLVTVCNHFNPTEPGEYKLMSSLFVTYAITFCALTLFPASSSGGAKTAMAPLPGTTATMPPPTPLLDGRPTCQAQPPEPSYSPAMVIVARMYGMSSRFITCSPLPGLMPWFARVAPIRANWAALTPTEHCFV